MSKFKNDLEYTARSHYVKFTNLLNNLPKIKYLIPPRMTGSGSTIFVTFSSYFQAKQYFDFISKTNQDLWVKMSPINL